MSKKIYIWILILCVNAVISWAAQNIIEVGISYDNPNVNITYAKITSGYAQDNLGGDYELRLYSGNNIIFQTNFFIPVQISSTQLIIRNKTDIIVRVPYFENITLVEVVGYDSVEFKPRRSFSTMDASNVCIPVKINGEIADKLDVVFVSDDFIDLDEFRNQVIRLIDFNAQYNGLLSIEPIKSNKYRMNFYYINKSHTALVYSPGGGYAYKRSDILNAASPCPYDKVILVTKDNINSLAELNGALVILNYAHVQWVGNVLIHEFGHLFGGLADEYTYAYSSRPYNHYTSQSPPANVDIAGQYTACPKWCNGTRSLEEIKSFDCSSWNDFTQPCANVGGNNVNIFSFCTSINNSAECGSHALYPNENCLWLSQKEPYFQSNCIPVTSYLSINIGANCSENLGCYAYASYAGWYRPIVDSMMKNNVMDFGPISRTALQQKFDLYPDHVLFEFELKKGWNMISFPAKPVNNSIADMFGSNATLYGYWDGVYSVADFINESVGYWVKLASDMNISYNGKLSYPDFPYGLNLVSFIGDEPMTVGGYFKDVWGNFSSAYYYNTTHWLTYSKNKAANSLIEIRPGQGIFVRLI